MIAKTRTAFILLLITLLAEPYAIAQTHRGSIRGTVTDRNRAAIGGAAITVTHEGTGEQRDVTTNDEGQYVVSLLPPGSYRIEAEATGYKKYVQTLTLQVNQELRSDLSLEVGNITEELLVVAPGTALRKDSPAIGTVIENRQVTGLPLDGRNFLELSLLVPGAVPSAPGSAGSVRGDFAFNVNGAREDSNNFLLDGVYNIDPKLNTVGVKPPVDAIREFELLTSTYDASFGRNPGAQVNVVLNSGTNSLHGTAYEFFRNAALDARNFFAPADQPDPTYQRNQFGFSLGGPMIRNRTFFFADYEGTRIREGITRITNVPTLAERSGDFSESLFPRPINPFTGQRFPGDQIPAEFQHPVGAAIAALYPAPNRDVPFQNFVSSPTQRDRNDHFDIRVDHKLSRRSDLAFRYSFADRDLFEPFAGPSFSALPGFGNHVPRRGQNLMIGETHVFSPSLINEARFAFNRVASAVIQEGRGTSINSRV
ncbi:MAG TPA: carboxypeptidase-like regulatory domain-containing protein, partial [Blastocatellia bacterium]|nr:carboxypeptidase-like regulatory domain-containing protein [Blastocatellia bacterium]